MKNKKFDIIRLIVGFLVLIASLILKFTIGDKEVFNTTYSIILILPLTLSAYLFVSYDLFFKSFKKIKSKQFFDEVILSLIATIAAFAIGEYIEGLAVILFYKIGEYIENYGYAKSKDSMKEIMEMYPDIVHLYNNNEENDVDPYDINVGDLFIVKPGERIPLDGIVIKGNSTLDTSSMTGESLPKTIRENEEIISGVINLSSPLIIKAIKAFYDSTLAKILDMVENSTNTKTKEEKFISKFARIYTPIVITLALLISVIPPLFIGINNLDVWKDWIYKGASFLVVSCPCAFIISVPMAFFIGIGQASRNKVIIKGSVYLEKLANLDTLVLDKTGTITEGNFEIDNIIKNNEDYDILELANAAEFYSNHPIALAIKRFNNYEIDSTFIKDYKEIEGRGISLFYKNKRLLVGNSKLLDENNIEFNKVNEAGTLIYVAYDNLFIGTLIIKDQIRATSIESIKKFNTKNNEVYMLTGDNKEIALSIAKECNIKNVNYNLLPLDKVKILEDILNKKDKHSVVAFVGDGVNDALSLKKADLGISMGLNGSDAAIEASDIILMKNDLNLINKSKNLAKSTLNVAYQNIIFSISTKIIILILTALGILKEGALWIAIFGDVGVTLICVLNSLRLMRKKL